jgi:hypothetical protein
MDSRYLPNPQLSRHNFPNIFNIRPNLPLQPTYNLHVQNISTFILKNTDINKILL